jgi:hypothetical protein
MCMKEYGCCPKFEKLGLTSEFVAPRSVRSVVICVIWSCEAGCLSSDNMCIFKFFRTLLTWDLARVGGKLTTIVIP